MEEIKMETKKGASNSEKNTDKELKKNGRNKNGNIKMSQ